LKEAKYLNGAGEWGLPALDKEEREQLELSAQIGKLDKTNILLGASPERSLLGVHTATENSPGIYILSLR